MDPIRIIQIVLVGIIVVFMLYLVSVIFLLKSFIKYIYKVDKDKAIKRGKFLSVYFILAKNARQSVSLMLAERFICECCKQYFVYYIEKVNKPRLLFTKHYLKFVFNVHILNDMDLTRQSANDFLSVYVHPKERATYEKWKEIVLIILNYKEKSAPIKSLKDRISMVDKKAAGTLINKILEQIMSEDESAYKTPSK